MLKLKNPRVCKHPYDMPWKACCICSADTDASVASTTIMTDWTMDPYLDENFTFYHSIADVPVNVFANGAELTKLTPINNPARYMIQASSWIYYADDTPYVAYANRLYVKLSTTAPPWPYFGSVSATTVITYTTEIPLIEVRKYPICMMVKHDGKWYCREHFTWRFKKLLTDEPIDIVEEELDVD